MVGFELFGSASEVIGGAHDAGVAAPTVVAATVEFAALLVAGFASLKVGDVVGVCKVSACPCPAELVAAVAELVAAVTAAGSATATTGDLDTHTHKYVSTFM
jgi:hypothetical protein